MKKIAFLILFFLNAAWLGAQQELGLSMIPQLGQSSQLHPALFTESRVVLAFPSFSTAFYNSSFQFGDLLRKEGAGYVVDLEAALAEMSVDRNLFTSNSRFSIGSLSLQLKRWQFSIFHNTHFLTHFRYPKALPEILWRGNAYYIGQEVQVAPSLNLMGYNEYGLGVAHQINKRLSIGVNLKALSGFLAVNTIRSRTTLYTDPEIYQITASSDILFQTAGLTDIFDENESDVLATTDPFYYIANQNLGFALDIGAVIQANDQLRILASIRDIGSISWDEYTLQQESRKNFQFDGLNVRPFDDENDDFDFEVIRDSITDLFDFQKSEVSFQTDLPTSFTAGALIDLNPSLNVGIALQGEFFQGSMNPAISFHAQKAFGRVLHLGGFTALRDKGTVNLGLNMNLNLGPVQFYALTDNIITLIDPTSGQNTSIRLGMNLLLFNKHKKAKDGETPPTPESQPQPEEGKELFDNRFQNEP